MYSINTDRTSWLTHDSQVVKGSRGFATDQPLANGLTVEHSLSQQGVWGSKLLHTQTLKNHQSGHPIILGSDYFKCQHKIQVFPPNIIPMALCKDLMPYFNE